MPDKPLPLLGGGRVRRPGEAEPPLARHVILRARWLQLGSDGASDRVNDHGGRDQADGLGQGEGRATFHLRKPSIDRIAPRVAMASRGSDTAASSSQNAALYIARMDRDARKVKE